MYFALSEISIPASPYGFTLEKYPFGGLRFFSTWVKTHSVLWF
jgi:hypothetical protein